MDTPRLAGRNSLSRGRRSAASTKPRAKARFLLEILEDRTLLSTATLIAPDGLPDAYDPSAVLVRFASETQHPDVSQIIPGAVLGKELSLVPGLHEVTLPANVVVSQAIVAFQANDSILYADPSYYRQLTDTTPNDPSFGTLYGMQKIKAPQAWDLATGQTNIVVAVIDTGIDYNHPDLYLNVWINQGEIPATRLANLSDADSDGLITFWDLNNPVNQGSGKITDLNADGRIDGGDILTNMSKDGNGNDTGAGGWVDSVDQLSNGFIDDLVGWDAYSGDKIPNDGYGHGTHVSGTIGAIGNNGVGVAGVNWKSQIMSLRIFGSSGGYAGDAEVIDMFAYAIANGAKVSNNSWGGGGYSQAMNDAIDAMATAGHIFVAAAGNYSSNNDAFKFYPASYASPNIMSVAATDSNDNKASFSNYGATTVDLGAPGVDVNSTLPTAGSLMGTNYGYASGTSMASPHTAGAVALLWSEHPSWSYRRVIRQILNNVDVVSSLVGKTVTGGRLNIGKAVVNAPGSPAPAPPAPGRQSGTGNIHVASQPIDGSGFVVAPSANAHANQETMATGSSPYFLSLAAKRAAQPSIDAGFLVGGLSIDGILD